MKKVICLSLCLVLLTALLFGCGAEGPQGRYVLSSFSIEGITYSPEELQTMGMDAEISIQFANDGSGALRYGGREMDFTWDSSSLHTEEDELDYRFEEDTVTLLYQGTEMVFTRES